MGQVPLMLPAEPPLKVRSCTTKVPARLSVPLPTVRSCMVLSPEKWAVPLLTTTSAWVLWVGKVTVPAETSSVPAPLMVEVLRLWVPPPNSKVVVATWLNEPAWVPPPVNFTAPPVTLRLPVLLKAAEIASSPLPCFSKVPALLMVPPPLVVNQDEATLPTKVWPAAKFMVQL